MALIFCEVCEKTHDRLTNCDGSQYRPEDDPSQRPADPDPGTA